MKTTQAIPEKDTDDEAKSNCDNDWCDGPDGDELPCFECFDLTKDYGLDASDGA